MLSCDRYILPPSTHDVQNLIAHPFCGVVINYRCESYSCTVRKTTPAEVCE